MHGRETGQREPVSSNNAWQCRCHEGSKAKTSASAVRAFSVEAPGTIVANRSGGHQPKLEVPMNQQTLKLDAQHSQTLTPRLQYAVRLLQLSSLDYEQELHDVMGRNPFLEADEAAPAPGSVADTPFDNGWTDSTPADQPDHAVLRAEGSSDDAVSDEHSNNVSDEPAERDAWMQSSSGIRDGGNDARVSAIDMMVADVGLRNHLRSQANILPLSSRDHALVCTIIESLDDDGYLRCELDELAELCDLEPAADACEMSTALKLVQSFEPAGVAARSVCECLMLQLGQVDERLRDLCSRILTDHMDRLAQRDVAAMARATGRTPAEVDAACTAIRRLDPRPGWRFGHSDVHFVVPDIVVRKRRGKWDAQLNDAVVPKLRLNETYARMFQRHRQASNGELATHLQEARWTLRNVQQRFSTILMVSQAILRRQYGFFEYGPLAMKPMALRDVAEEVGLHESTVCRVTNNKYMATPAGVFELKHFFSRRMPMADGKACSATAIRGLVKEMIEAEHPAHPLSDVELALRLKRQGLTVARRTVTKYRQMLQVLPVEQRRRHATAYGELGGDSAPSHVAIEASLS
jgi:RNA polymerase sigma-54 factor